MDNASRLVRMRLKLDLIIGCFFMTSLALISSAVFLVLALFFGIVPWVVLWLIVSVIVAIAFGITADIILFSDKLLVYRLFRRLNQPLR